MRLAYDWEETKKWLEAVDTELRIIGDPNDQVVEVS